MKKLFVLLVAGAGLAGAQGRPIDWTSYGADAQRTGWEKSDSRITKENVKDFQLVLKRNLDNRQNGPNSLTPPVVIGTLISYRGFKELAFVAGSSDAVWAIDADLDRIFWEKRFKSLPNPAPCRGVAVPALTPPVRRGHGRTAPASSRLGATTFGAPRPLFVLSSDGKLHLLNTSKGDETGSALDFLPPNAKASNLTLSDGVIYTTTHAGCGGVPSGVWALDLYDDDPEPVSFVPKEGNVGGLGGIAIGIDETVYAQTELLMALSPRDLQPKQSFTGHTLGPVTPAVFSWKGKEMVVCAGKNGSLYLLDASALDTAVYETKPLSSGSFWGGLSSWEDGDGARWILAPVWGTPSGSIVAFKIEEQNGKPELRQAWTSRDMNSPEPPVITSGVVFALASGGTAHAVLYALDGLTGKEMYSSGNQVTAPANLTGLTIANGRVYFTTTDNTLYAFGIFLER